MKTVLIANPASGGFRAQRRLAVAAPALTEALGDYEFVRTTGPGDGRRLAAAAVVSGATRIIAAGGDGTASEVAAGILDASGGGSVTLGLLPGGSAQDVLRNLGLPRNLPAAMTVIRDGHVREIDVGHATVTGAGASSGGIRFVNDASFGASAMVAGAVGEGRRGGWHRYVPPRVGFAVGAARAAAGVRPVSLSLEVDGKAFFSGRAVFGAAANGRCFGGGMQVAPQAELDDGLLDVVVVPDLPKARLFRHLPTLYSGGLLEVPGVQATRGERVVIRAEGPQSVPVETDGEVVGRLPAELTVEPRALRVLVPKR